MGRGFAIAGTAVGVYLGAVGVDVYRASHGAQSLQAEVDTQMREAAAAERSAKEEERAISSFEDAIKEQQQGIEHVDAEIAVVQLRLDELQQLREAKLKETADAQAALEEARNKLIKLVQDARRHSQAATAAEQALTAAQQHALAAKQGIYPLQHPLIRPFLRRS